MAAQTGVAGSTKIGKYCFIGGQVGFAGHLNIGNMVKIGAQSGIMTNLKDGETVYYSRAHQMKLQMEKDYGIYKGTAIKKEVLLHEDRYVRACDSIGYEFNLNGVSEKAP